MADDKKSDFVVSDRRKFTAEGERRPGVKDEEAPAPAAAKPAPAAAAAAPAAAAPAASAPPKAAAEAAAEEMPPPPTDEEAAQQKSAYEESTRKLNDQLKERMGGRDPKQFEMTFERFAASLYMTALLQLGMAAPEGEQPRVDIMGARQTIDTIALLQEKTKGNLTEHEKNMLQQAIYELRMAWLEVMNALSRPPEPGAPGGPGGSKIPSGPGPTRIR
jgi:uncharacterized protein DUF1844